MNQAIKEKKIENMTEEEIQAMIDRRVWNIKQAHANNKLEGIDLGEESLKKSIERAKLRLPSKEVKNLGMLAIAKKYKLDPKLLLDDC